MYRKGDMVEINEPGGPFHGRIGEVIFADHEALRVDVCPKWYWGEGDVREAGFETAVSLQAYPMGTIVETESGQLWVRISGDTWAAERTVGFKTVAALPSSALPTYNVKRIFLGMME